jgi:hypothetical protein
MGTPTGDPLAQFDREERALRAARELIDLYGGYQAFLTKCKEVRGLFEEAGMEPLPSVSTLLDLGDGRPAAQSSGSERPKLIVTPPPTPPRPAGAKPDWIWVPLAELTTQSLILCLLRDWNGPVPSQALFEQMQEFDPDVNHGSVLNAGARMDGTLIERSKEGWQVIDKTKVPEQVGPNAWGPLSVFQPSEVTFYRRGLIRHILQANGRGMQLIEVYHRLKDSGFLPGTGKDQVKGDLEALDAKGEIRAYGPVNRSRWVVVDKNEEKAK